MRPTGRLHIGHYFGALENWVKLQNDPQYECFFFVADWHALTSDYADTSQIAQNTIEIATDWLASGLDPAKCTLFIQSSVPEHAELQLLLSMVTPLGWLERVPHTKRPSTTSRTRTCTRMVFSVIRFSDFGYRHVWENRDGVICSSRRGPKIPCRIGPRNRPEVQHSHGPRHRYGWAHRDAEHRI